MINSQSDLAGRFWRDGRSDDCPIIDMHAHMGLFSAGYMPGQSAESMLESMRRSNTILTCFVSHDALQTPIAGKNNDLAIARKYPDRFKVYHIVSSNCLESEDDLRRVDQNRFSYVGFKFHGDAFKVALSDKRHRPYWEYADANELLVLSHTWQDSPYDGPDEVEMILERYPDLVFIAGHSFHADWSSAIRLSRKYPNLYLELTAVLDDRGALDLLVDQAGSEKILFGVDLPWFSYHHGIGSVLSAKISDTDRRNIFYRNGKRLLSRFAWFEQYWQNAAGNLE